MSRTTEPDALPTCCCPGSTRRPWTRPLPLVISPHGRRLQRLAAYELGGTPATDPRAWASRSPLSFARAIAFSHVPLEIWWSRTDPIVVDQAGQSGLLYREIKHIDQSAPVRQFVGR